MKCRAELARGFGERLVERDLAADVAPQRAGKVAHLVEQDMRQDLPQPGRQLGLGAAAELAIAPDGLEQRLLHDIRRVELGPEPRLDLKPGQEAEPASITLERGDTGLSIGIAHTVLSSREEAAPTAHANTLRLA